MIAKYLIDEIVDLTLRVKQEELDPRELSDDSIEELEDKKRELMIMLTPEWYEFE